MTEKTKKKSTPVKDGLYKRGTSWCIRVMVNGKLVRQTIGPDKAKAQAVLAEIISRRALYRATTEMAGIDAMFKKKERKTFAEAAAVYMADRADTHKTSTKRGYNEIFKNHLLPRFGKLSVEQITEEMISSFRTELAAKVSATRANNIMGPLRYILKLCVRKKWLTENPALNVDPLEEKDTIIDPLTPEELDSVIKALKPHQRPLFICLAWTGARPNELFALKWDDVKFPSNELEITKGRVRGTVGPPKTKSSVRTIHMVSAVREALLVLHQSPTKHIDDYVFLTKNGQPYSKHVDREWRTALRKAKVRHRPSYQLRHTFASLCLQNGLQATWLAKMLGHSNPQTTFKHYARFIDDGSKVNETRLEEYLQSKKPARLPRTLGAG